MSNDKKPVIAFTRYTPYMLIDADEIQNYKKIFVGPKKEDSKNDAS